MKRYMVISPGTHLLCQENGEKGIQMLHMASPSSTLGSQAEADLGSLSPEPEEAPALLWLAPKCSHDRPPWAHSSCDSSNLTPPKGCLVVAPLTWAPLFPVPQRSLDSQTEGGQLSQRLGWPWGLCFMLADRGVPALCQPTAAHSPSPSPHQLRTHMRSDTLPEHKACPPPLPTAAAP